MFFVRIIWKREREWWCREGIDGDEESEESFSWAIRVEMFEGKVYNGVVFFEDNGVYK